MDWKRGRVDLWIKLWERNRETRVMYLSVFVSYHCGQRYLSLRPISFIMQNLGFTARCDRR